MITQDDRNLYKKLCIIIGAFQELIQGAGGNISIKSDTQIILKASGSVLSETTDNEGFVVCRYPSLEVLEGKGSPSMESGFHCLPKRIIVHFHSLSCLSEYQFEQHMDILSLPYIQPGKHLSYTLHAEYQNQSLVSLGKHGIILFADTEMELFAVFERYFPAEFCTILFRIRELYEATSSCILETYTKKRRFSFFVPYTPDFYLFLKEKPLFLDPLEPVHPRLKEYLSEYKSFPSIVYLGTYTFCIASSWKKCFNVRDMFEAYCRLLQSPPPTCLSKEDCQALLQCEKEAYRLR